MVEKAVSLNEAFVRMLLTSWYSLVARLPPRLNLKGSSSSSDTSNDRSLGEEKMPMRMNNDRRKALCLVQRRRRQRTEEAAEGQNVKRTTRGEEPLRSHFSSPPPQRLIACASFPVKAGKGKPPFMSGPQCRPHTARSDPTSPDRSPSGCRTERPSECTQRPSL